MYVRHKSLQAARTSKGPQLAHEAAAVSSSDTRLSSPAQDTTIQPLPAGSVNRIGRAWCSAMQAGCRWWNDAECLGSCEMARVQLGKPLPAVGCD